MIFLHSHQLEIPVEINVITYLNWYYFTKGPTRNLDKSLVPLNRSSCVDYKHHKISCRKLIITEIIAFSNINISGFFFLYSE